MKKSICFLTGFICAAVLFSSSPIKAATDYINAYFNNNQKVTVNGVEQQIQFLNASNTNYGKLRDIVKVLGGETNYNDATQTIEITTTAATPAPTENPATNNNTGGNNMTKTVDLTQWISLTDLAEKYLVKVEVSDKISISKDKIKFNIMFTDVPKTFGTISTIQTEVGLISVQSNGHTFLKISEMQKIGLIP